MAFYVLTYRETPLARLDGVLGRIRENLADPASLESGRRSTRLFQRLGEPAHLLTLSEWADERAFRQFWGSSHVAETDQLNGASASFTPLVPLIRYEHMARRAVIGSCVTVTARPEATTELQSFLVGDAHREMKTLGGIVSREVYIARDTPGTFLVVHSWQALADLERFRATEALILDQIHDRLQTTMVPFTGALALQFSAFRPPA